MTLAPWWWSLREPKHGGAAFTFLVCFNNPTIYIIECTSWTIKYLILLMHGASMKSPLLLHATDVIMETPKWDPSEWQQWSRDDVLYPNSISQCITEILQAATRTWVAGQFKFFTANSSYTHHKNKHSTVFHSITATVNSFCKTESKQNYVLLLQQHDPFTAPYTLSVKLCDFTVWRHTSRKIE